MGLFARPQTDFKSVIIIINLIRESGQLCQFWQGLWQSACLLAQITAFKFGCRATWLLPTLLIIFQVFADVIATYPCNKVLQISKVGSSHVAWKILGGCKKANTPASSSVSMLSTGLAAAAEIRHN